MTSLRIPHAQDPPLLQLGSLSCTMQPHHAPEPDYPAHQTAAALQQSGSDQDNQQLEQTAARPPATTNMTTSSLNPSLSRAQVLVLTNNANNANNYPDNQQRQPTNMTTSSLDSSLSPAQVLVLSNNANNANYANNANNANHPDNQQTSTQLPASTTTNPLQDPARAVSSSPSSLQTALHRPDRHKSQHQPDRHQNKSIAADTPNRDQQQQLTDINQEHARAQSDRDLDETVDMTAQIRTNYGLPEGLNDRDFLQLLGLAFQTEPEPSPNGCLVSLVGSWYSSSRGTVGESYFFSETACQ